MTVRALDVHRSRLRLGRCAAAMLTLASLAGGPRALGDDAERPPIRSDIRTLVGTIAEIAVDQRRITVHGPAGVFALTFDRNTSVFLEHRLGSVRDLSAGALVRAASGADGRAAWIEVLPVAPPAASPSRRAQDRAEAPKAAPGTGGVPSGPPPPPPDAGAAASLPTRPRPAGPGPVPGGAGR